MEISDLRASAAAVTAEPPDHAPYGMREIAWNQVELMARSRAVPETVEQHIPSAHQTTGYAPVHALERHRRWAAPIGGSMRA